MNCNCGEAKLLEVKKPGANQGRKFYGCAKPQGSQCDFFCWEGETPRGVGKRAGGAVPSQREELTGKVLASMNAKLDKILERLDGMAEFLKKNTGVPPVYQKETKDF